jgi:thioredoxin reductase (NADPH)
MEPYEIIIVGGGMAGLSAALYAGWLGCNVLLVERQAFGGQVVNADQIENFPGFPDGILGADLVSCARMQAMKFGAKMRYAEITSVNRRGERFVLDSTEGSYEAAGVIIATGGKARRLGVKGEAELEGKGVSRCATCDGAFFADKPVAVIGGGDTALDEAIYLSQVASKVTILHHGERLAGSHTLVTRVKENPKIECVAGAVVEEIIGVDAVAGVRLHNGAKLSVEGVFIAIGFDPETALLQALVNLDSMGHARVDLQMQTSVPGLYAVGSARQGHVGQLISAAGDGVTAAVAAHHYLARGTR